MIKILQQPVEIKADKEGIISGYLASFNTVDSDNEIFAPGAFAKTLKENSARIKFLLNHNPYQPIGRFTELKEDTQGLRYIAKLGTHALGLEAKTMVNEGLLTEHSIGFDTVKSKKENGRRVITEVKLWEGSLLTHWGANPNTPVISLKNADAITLTLARLSHLANSKAEPSRELIEYEINQLKNMLQGQPTEADTTTRNSLQPDELKQYLKKLNLMFKAVA